MKEEERKQMKRKPEKEIDRVLLTAHTEVDMVGTDIKGPTCKSGAKERQ